MKKLFLLFLAVGLMVACSKDDESKDLSPQQAENALNDMATDMTGDIEDLLQSEGGLALNDLITLLFTAEFNDDDVIIVGDPLRKDSWLESARQMGEILGKKPIQRVGGDVEEEFPSGQYDWDAENEEFVQDKNVNTNDLILNFPTTGSNTNNATFTLSDLEFSEFDLPTAIEAEIVVDGVTVMSVDFSLSLSNEGYPDGISLNLFLKPFEFQLTANLSGNNESLFFSLNNANELIAEIDLEVTSGNDEFLTSVSGSITYRSVSLRGSANLADMEAAFDAGTDPNEHHDLAIFVRNKFAGDIVLVEETEDGDSYYVPYIEFKDGTRKSLEDFLAPVIEALEDSFMGA
jgi:hypothetical protein